MRSWRQKTNIATDDDVLNIPFRDAESYLQVHEKRLYGPLMKNDYRYH